ncbi:hypothetical protein I4U23_012059 [Adineta vaga]|nr:hypothetical protein I4U23_012059 [Adineta vaga]
MDQNAKMICQICGAPALFTNFGIVSCASCKMFFKRNAETKKNSFQCDLQNDCDININNRRTCSACRLKKCFTQGMQIELIRGSRVRKNMKRKKTMNHASIELIELSKNNRLQLLPIVNLIHSNQSILTKDQWDLLSNLIHCYDEYSGVRMAQLFDDKQNCLPLKLRFKFEPTAEFITSNMSCVPEIFEKNLHFRSLSYHDRSILLRNTVKHTGCIGGTFVLHQSQLLHDPLFYQTTTTIFGSDIMSRIIPLTESFDRDETFVKLILTIIAFSTTTYTIYSQTNFNNLNNLKQILQIQDIYTELAWRYMIYRYNYDQAVIQFCQLIQCLFRVNSTIVEVDRNQEYTSIIGTVIEQTEQLLLGNE